MVNLTKTYYTESSEKPSNLGFHLTWLRPWEHPICVLKGNQVKQSKVREWNEELFRFWQILEV